MGVLWETSFWAFFFLTVVIAGGAAMATGRALAKAWRPYWQVVFYMVLLGFADRFLHWGLFLDRPLDVYKGSLFSVHYYLVDTTILLVFASLAYRVTRAGQMATQYHWLYRRTGPLTWAKRDGSES
ncbi:MAG: hypothetical protein MI824_12480 [Hyphomicrobiales bacterium]|nr:hypothetical protein [Hyphomicrobiales bacterium]